MAPREQPAPKPKSFKPNSSDSKLATRSPIASMLLAKSETKTKKLLIGLRLMFILLANSNSNEEKRRLVITVKVTLLASMHAPHAIQRLYKPGERRATLWHTKACILVGNIWIANALVVIPQGGATAVVFQTLAL